MKVGDWWRMKAAMLAAGPLAKDNIDGITADLDAAGVPYSDSEGLPASAWARVRWMIHNWIPSRVTVVVEVAPDGAGWKVAGVDVYSSWEEAEQRRREIQATGRASAIATRQVFGAHPLPGLPASKAIRLNARRGAVVPVACDTFGGVEVVEALEAPAS